MTRMGLYARVAGSVGRILRAALAGRLHSESAITPILSGPILSEQQRAYVAAGVAAAGPDIRGAREQKLIRNVMVQRLSGFGEDVPSPYFDLDLKSRDVLDIAFTHAQMPSGTFSFTGVYDSSPHSVLHLNTANSDYYQNGIPGATRSIAETAAWLRSIRSSFGFKTVRTIGASMAGYAAILFGDLVAADMVCAISPVINPAHTFLGKSVRFDSVDAALIRIKARSTILFGAFDVPEYKLIASCLDLGLRLDDLAVVGNGHGPIASLNLLKLITSGGTIPAADLMVNPHTIPLSDDMIREVGGLELYSADRDDNRVVEVLGRAAAIDAVNPDFRYRRGVHLGLLGRRDEAVQDIREAIALNAYHVKTIGIDVFGAYAEYDKRVIKDYGVHLDFGRLKSLVDVVKEAAASAKASPIAAG